MSIRYVRERTIVPAPLPPAPLRMQRGDVVSLTTGRLVTAAPPRDRPATIDYRKH